MTKRKYLLVRKYRRPKRFIEENKFSKSLLIYGEAKMKRNIGLTLIFFGILFVSQSVKAQKIVNVTVVQPQTEFDFKLAAEMINAGNSQIIGKALFETKAGLIGRKIEPDTYAKRGNVVTLYPITPYFQEFLELRKKDKKDRQMAAISREANSFRVLTKVYSDTGDFKFVGLKPGKYFLECFVYYLSGIGGYEVNGIVEIKTDGEVVNVELKDKYEPKNPRVNFQ